MRKQPRQKPSPLTAVDSEILQLVRTYHFVTVDQLIRLRYSKGTKTTVQTKLKQLFESKYLDRRALPHLTPGNTEYIYALSTKGINTLKDMGFTGFSRFRPDELRNYAFPHLDHCKALNDFLICANMVERFVPSISCVEMRHDLDLKKTPVKVIVERRLSYRERIDETIIIIPDGWLDFRMVVPGREKPRRRCIVVELDRGTTSVAPFKEKLRAYYGYALSEEYQQLFSTDLCMVAYATTAGRQRLKQMLEWCEQELEQQQLAHEANLYRFTALPASEYNPQEIFCSEMWYKPFEDDPISLLWKL